MSGALTLHGYWRSGASYRVRIALNLKRLSYHQLAHDLRAGAQRDPAYRALNPQAMVPALAIDEGGGVGESAGGEALVIAQSPAILEWLDERYPDPPLLPADPLARAQVRAMAAVICCDIHPLNNLRVLQALRRELGAGDEQISRWTARWIGDGFAALDALVARHGAGFCYGAAPGLADCCLIPQLYSARRFAVDLAPYPQLLAVEARCLALEPFAAADPARQPDAD